MAIIRNRCARAEGCNCNYKLSNLLTLCFQNDLLKLCLQKILGIVSKPQAFLSERKDKSFSQSVICR